MKQELDENSTKPPRHKHEIENAKKIQFQREKIDKI